MYIWDYNPNESHVLRDERSILSEKILKICNRIFRSSAEKEVPMDFRYH